MTPGLGNQGYGNEIMECFLFCGRITQKQTFRDGENQKFRMNKKIPIKGVESATATVAYQHLWRRSGVTKLLGFK